MIDGLVRTIPREPTLPRFIGSSGNIGAGLPGVHSATLPGDLVVAAIQDTADNASFGYTASGFWIVANQICSESVWHGARILGIAGIYQAGMTISFSGASNHNLVASWTFRGTRSTRLIGTRENNNASVSSFTFLSTAGTLQKNAMVVALVGCGEASPAPSSHTIAGAFATPFGYTSTAVGRAGTLAMFGLVLPYARPHGSIVYNATGAAEHVASIFELLPA